MNKFGILLCFLLTINFSQSTLPEIDMGVVYDIIVALMKGMSETSEAKCANTYASLKDMIVPSLQAIWEDMRKGIDFQTAAMAHPPKDMARLEEIEINCHAFEKIQEFAGFTARGIQQIGYNIIQNSVEIEGLITELIKTPDFEGKIIVFGKILRTATGIYFA